MSPRAITGRPGPVACLVFTRQPPPGAVVSELFRRGFMVIERPFSDTLHDLLAEIRPDVVLATLDPREEEDIGALRQVAAHAADRIVLAVIEPYTDQLAMIALEAGAVVVLAATASPELTGAQAAAIVRGSDRRIDDGISEIAAGDLVINLDRRLVAFAGSRVELTKSEFDILALLARNSGRVIGPAEIVAGIGQAPGSPAQARGVVKVHVSHLRNKLAAFGADDYVVTVRGVGYLFERRAASRARSAGEDERKAAFA